MIGENGSELSGGERQRISIARAFLKDAPIILMDEATASLDVDNESLIQESISKLIQNINNVDKIVVLKDGKVAESGTPDELKKSTESISICQICRFVQNSGNINKKGLAIIIVSLFYSFRKILFF